MSITPTIPAPAPSYPTTVSARQLVVVTDIDMTMGAMCRFMIKWIIASIPAIIISSLILIVVGGVAAALFGGLFAALMRH